MNSRQAINLLKGLEQSLDDYCELNDEGKAAFRMAIEALELFGNAEQLPSAQPYTDEEIQKIQGIEQAQLEKAYEMGKADALRWIPCSERLPDVECGESDIVLVTCGYMNVKDTSVRWIKTLYFNGGNWCYPTGETYEQKVYAWMPLPEPYKGGKHETD